MRASDTNPFTSASQLEARIHSRSAVVAVESFLPTEDHGTLPSIDEGQYRLSIALTASNEALLGRGGSRFYDFSGGDRSTCVLVGSTDTFLGAVDGDRREVELPLDLAGMSATVLEDGLVFFAGGATLDQDGRIERVSDRAYLYDPDCGAVEEIAAPLGNARAWHTATLLKRDETDRVQRVLLAGGLSIIADEVQALVTAEVFDPSTRGFRGAAAMAEARFGHAAELLVSGDVLVVGGAAAMSTPAPASLQDVVINAPVRSRTGELFRPQRTGGAFEPVQNRLEAARMWATAHRAQDDRVAIVGGLGEGGPVEMVELYLPASNRFQPDQTSGLRRPRYGHVSLRLTESSRGEIMIGGGLDADGDALSHVEVYTVGRGSESAKPLAAPRAFASISRLGAARFLIAGGLGASPDRGGEPLGSAEVWSSGTATLVDGCPQNPDGFACGLGSDFNGGDGRVWHATAVLQSGVVLIAGGATLRGGAWRGARRVELYVPEEE